MSAHVDMMSVSVKYHVSSDVVPLSRGFTYGGDWHCGECQGVSMSDLEWDEKKWGTSPKSDADLDDRLFRPFYDDNDVVDEAPDDPEYNGDHKAPRLQGIVLVPALLVRVKVNAKVKAKKSS